MRTALPWWCTVLFFAAALLAQPADSLRTALGTRTGADRLPLLIDLNANLYRSAPAEARRYGDEALALLERFPHPQRRMRTLRQMSMTLLGLSDYPGALNYGEAARSLASSVRDTVEMARAANAVAMARYALADFSGAIAASQEAESLATASADTRLLAEVRHHIGQALHGSSDLSRALEFYFLALNGFESCGDDLGVARTLHRLADIYRELDIPVRAGEHYRRALELRDRAGVSSDPVGYAETLRALGDLYVAEGEPERGHAMHIEALDILRRAGNPSGVAAALGDLGRIHQGLGRDEEALAHFEEAIALYRKMDTPLAAAELLTRAGRIHLDAGRSAEALGVVREALAIARRHHSRIDEKEALAALARIEESRGNFRGALAHYRLVTALGDSIYSRDLTLQLASLESRAEAERRDREIKLLKATNALHQADLEQAGIHTRYITIFAILILATAVSGSLILMKTRRKNRILYRTNRELQRSMTELSEREAELNEAIAQIKTLEGFFSICASCKNIRTEEGHWQQIEAYIRDHSEARFSHGICPTCMDKLYPGMARKKTGS